MIDAATSVDWVVVAVFAASIVLSLTRGLVQEVASFAIWVVATVLAWKLAPMAVDVVPTWVENARLKFFLAFGLVTVVTVLLGKFVVSALQALIDASGARWLDRLLGLGFGLLRAALIVTSVAALVMMTGIRQTEAWQNALLRPWLEVSVKVVRPWLPDNLQQLIRVI